MWLGMGTDCGPPNPCLGGAEVTRAFTCSEHGSQGRIWIELGDGDAKTPGDNIDPRLAGVVNLLVEFGTAALGEVNVAVGCDVHAFGGTATATVAGDGLSAEIALSEGRTVEALELAESVCSGAESNGRTPMRVAALELRARALLRDGEPEEALSAAATGIALAEDIRLVTVLWRLQAVRARALVALGREEEATEAYVSAADIVRQLAEAIPDDELKTGFLADEQVATVLDYSEKRTHPARHTILCAGRP